MALQYINKDVPAKLVALARQIDVEAYAPKERQLKLEELEALATKHIPVRPRNVSVQQTPIYDIHADLVEVLNKFDYSKIALWKMKAAEPLISNWVHKNLKLKK